MMAPILTNAEVQQRLPPQRREFTSERRRDPEHTQLTSAPAVDEYVQQCLGLRAAWPAHESGLVCQRRLWTPPTEEGSKGDSKEKKEDDEDMSLD
ncbi:proteasomal ubiquitin receptor ADRM1-like isoform X2 [Trachinotus anak]|uniref:proteasomal ubiquitin receptor ADRM1-like isoform X2 n=1 Tax=Trachinotus anak TaxID=443729 RepID=UPI0039F21C2B